MAVDKLQRAEGIISDNYGTTTLINNTLAARTITVPSNRRWWLFWVYSINGDNVTRNMMVEHYNSAGQLINMLFPLSAKTAGLLLCWPHTTSGTNYFAPAEAIPLKAGDYIVITWAAGGASAGGTAPSTMGALEVVV
jgi:hypothetical protein